MRRLKADLVDEHYYMSPDWFLQNAGRYDKYPRKGPKVFAGEYAAHGQGQRNNFEAALSEAAFMTGLERNADVVYMATYAPLFSHVEGRQWQPDLIWFDNLKSYCTPNYHVQQLYSQYKGTQVLKLSEGGQAVEGQNGLYASAVYDEGSKRYYVKVANTGTTAQDITVTFTGNRPLSKGQLVTFHANDADENSIAQPEKVKPQTTSLPVTTNGVETTIGARTFVVMVVE
jgi:alpha-L-arabinofuranosidase